MGYNPNIKLKGGESMADEDERLEGEMEEYEGELDEGTPARGWVPEEGAVGGTIHIDTGRGQTAEAQVGAPFVETLEQMADEFHYGGYFRVFLNGSELTESPWLDEAHMELNPSYPATIEAGMRLAITSYDKVGVQ